MPSSPWKTEITDTSGGQLRIRGVDISTAIQTYGFGSMVYLLWKGVEPGKAEARLMDAILVSTIDHGVTPPSSLTTRLVTSGGSPLNAAVAAGILTIGDKHGGTIEACARLYQERLMTRDEGPGIENLAEIIVQEYHEKKQRIPGYGHRIYKRDPRTESLISLAGELGLRDQAVDLALAIQNSLEEHFNGKPLPLNADGAIAALITDMGFDWRFGKGFFILSRTAGLIAHAYEESTKMKPLRSFGQTLPEYDGP